MKNKKRLSALIAAVAVAAFSTVSMSGSAVTTVRDANGDGKIYLNDVITTSYYLAGKYNPSSVKSFDFDGNGIISAMDSEKIQQYLVGNINDSSLPGPVGADSQAVATTRNYVRHYYNNSSSNTINEYSLTVNPFDNTVSSNSKTTQNRIIISDNDMIRDYDTAVVHIMKDNALYGSGFIIDDHIIATAAHCVYKCESQQFFNTKIKLVDKDNNETVVTPIYTDISKIYHNTTDYGDCEKYDYALIYVEEDLSEYGSFKLGSALSEYINNHGQVIVSGFPSSDWYPDNYQGLPFGIRFKAKGKIDSLENGRIYYDADTAGGDSGGPVYAEEAFITKNGTVYDYKTVIAINTAHDNEKNLNVGIRITPDILKFYNSNPNIEY